MGAFRFGVAGETDEGLGVSRAYKVISRERTGDVYLVRRGVGDRMKVSLHRDLWKVEYDGRGSRASPSTPHRRSWEPPEPDEQGLIVAVRLLITKLAVNRSVEDLPEDVTWVELPSGATGIEFRLWFSPAVQRILTGPDVGLVGVLPLPTLQRYLVATAWPSTLEPRGDFTVTVPDDIDPEVARERITQSGQDLMLWGVGKRCEIIDGLSADPVE